MPRAAGAGLLLLALAVGTVPAFGQEVCRHVGWEEPRPLPIDTIVGVSVSPAAGETWLIGHAVSPAGIPGLDRNTVVVYGLEQGWFPPPTNGPMINPRAAVDPEGRLHVVWAEFDSPVFYPFPTPGPAAILHSWMGEGGWSEPMTVVRSEVLRWWNSTASLTIHPDGSGASLVFVEGNSDGPAEVMSFADWDGVRWSLHHAVFRAGGAPRLHVDAEGNLLLFHTRALSERGRDASSLVMRRSHDRGRTWDEEVVVHFSGGARPVFTVTLQVSPDGRTHLVWLGSLRGERENQDALYQFSDDNGSTWSQPVTIVPRKAEGWRLATPALLQDLSGGIHFFVNASTFDEPGSTTHHSRIDRNGWQGTSTVPVPGPPVYANAVGMGHDGELLFVGMPIGPRSAGGGPPPLGPVFTLRNPWYCPGADG